MKITLITTTYNSSATITSCIHSVSIQNYTNIEYLVIDGKSKDNTLEIINSTHNRISKIISEPDKGLYDALNKGIKLATGDYIGILHSDDIFKNKDTLGKVAAYLKEHKPDCLFADVEICDQESLSKVKRRYSAKNFSPQLFKFGMMPPHPSVYIKREIFQKFGYYLTDYKIAADYEFLVRLLWKNKISYKYFPQTIVKMRDGGISNQKTLKNRRLITRNSKWPAKIMAFIQIGFY